MPLRDIGATIRALILLDDDVVDDVATRVHSDAIPQSALLPAISYRVIDTVANEALTGPADVFRARVEVNAHALTRSKANELAEYIRLALQLQHRGTAANGTVIREISLAIAEHYTSDRNESGTDQKRFVTSQDFFVSYSPST